MPPPAIFSGTVLLPLLLFQFFNLTTSFAEPNFSPFSGCDGTFSCGNIHNLSYPFTGGNQPDHCGPPEFHLSCVNNSYPELTVNSVVYRVLEVNLTGSSLVLARSDLWNNTCPTKFLNSSLDPNIFDSDNGQNVDLTIFYGCSSSPVLVQQQNRFYCDVGGVDLTDSFFIIGEVPIDPIRKMIHCRNGVTVPLLKSVGAELNRSLLTLAEALTRGFEVVYSDPCGDRCDECGRLDGECGFDVGTRQFACICDSRICSTPGNSKKGSLILTIIVPTVGVILVGAAIGWGFLVCRRRRRRRSTKEASTTQTESKSILTSGPSSRFYSDAQSDFNSSIPSYRSSKISKEFGKCSYFGAQVFTYEELEVATDNFSDSRELGDGGCGTVYHGKLLDGREVAVKRLYEHNYKRVEQFMNEVAILTRLDHENLVKLYGCTSKRSKELLLVYEYISNGTVADHLHGKLAKSNSGLLTWSVRLNIAIETAKALAYLHESDIIHRDVKTYNILLDKRFRVKVADFGLSRLFPNNATHVSTAPQGTPGYVDPQYYLCYQLTDKSDVFSFGVVLIELISSLQAVDISRDRLDINLAAMAINKIQSHRLDQLVDKNIGFETNGLVRRMITLVAELAFRCLQQESVMRPTMKEVVEILMGIQNDELNAQKPEVLDIGVDDGALFKDQNTEPPSPDYGATNKLYGSCMPNSSDG
ncbi:putative protein kinase RLK-Pelle-WAK-LRK10L-1 family [Helianthus anomalus]